MKILLTNDDGIEAPGLQALWQAVEHFLGDKANVTVVAPDRGRSECGHSVTTGRPLHLQQIRPNWFSLGGTPVDCVRVALSTLVSDADLLLSGVNAGANLGVDLLVSGTFAAAREGAIQKIPAMAVSHYRHPEVPKTWDHVPNWLAGTLGEFVRHVGEATQRRHTPLWNVNLPAIAPDAPVPASIRCAVDANPLHRVAKRRENEVIFESDFHGRPRTDGHDVARCFSGSVTISEIEPPF